jgi:antitoxin FitA
LQDRALAKCWHCRQTASVPVQITIRDVPEGVRDELAMRAARDRKSMQEYLRGELVRLAQRPSIETWLEQVRKRKEAEKRRVPAKEILRHRDADRR